MPETLVGTLDVPNTRVSVELVWDTSPVPDTALIERVDGSGMVLAVRGADPATLVSGEFIGDDYEAPLDEPFYYRATSEDRPGEVIESDTYEMASGGATWLKHPGRPFLNTTVTVSQPPSWTRPTLQGVFDVLGRGAPIAVTMRRSSARGDLVLATGNDAERAAILALIDDGAPLLLQGPGGYGVGSIYVSVGDVEEARVTRIGETPDRLWTLPLTVIDRPAGGALGAGNSWSDVLGNYASWSALQLAEGTWSGVLEGIEDD